MADENWEKVEQPTCVGEDFGLRLGVLGNDLSVFCNSPSHVNLSVMKKYGVKESWAKMYTIKRPILGMYVFTTPFCMSNKGEILLVFGSTSAIYNPKDDTMKYAEITNFGSFIASEFYIESLVCPISHQKNKQPRIQ
uniref:Putative ovule protein n=1 Tax=Solanum chacoense TaxID=4108 RepID=A0A0V0I693_SOLCH